MMKKTTALLLAVACFFLLFACEKDPQTDPKQKLPAEEEAGETEEETGLVERGNVGDSELIWEFYSDGTLYIKGSGDMPEFETHSTENSDLPWNPYRQGNIDTTLTIRSLVIAEGVTSVSPKAFQECLDLQKVSLPTTLKEIPYCAFTNCRKLTTVGGGLGVELIDENAFQGCTALQSVSLSTPLREVRLGAFAGCGAFSIYFTGSETEWQETMAAMTVESSNDAFRSARVICYER